MSINSFFNTRKSRNKNSIETNQFKQDVNVVSNFAAQAPQPIYEQLIKPTTVATTTNAEPLCKKSILYYLSPIKKNAEKDIGSVEETSLPCRIRTSIPVSLLWKDILEDFDPDSQPNQFSLDSRLLLQPETMDISSRLENKRRILQDNDVTRVSFFLKKKPSIKNISNMLILERSYSYAYISRYIKSIHVFGRLLIRRYTRRLI